MAKCFKQILPILLFLFLFVCQATAAEPLIIVRGQDFPPYHYLDRNGVEQGFIIEIIIGTAKLLDISVSFKQYPWSRCISMMENGHTDAMMNLFKTEKRKTFMYFSDNIIAHETNTLFTLNTTELMYSGDIQTITPFKIGTIRNYSYGNRFDAVTFPFNYQLETEKELIRSLINKRCDVIVGNKLTILTLLKQMGFEDRIKPLVPDISSDPLYISFSKARGHGALSKSFSQKLKQFKTSEKYQEIIRKYSLETL